MTLVSSERRSSRWIPLSLLLGLGLAVLLLINSIATYRLVSQRLAVDQARRDLSLRIASLDSRLRTASSDESITSLLEHIRSGSSGRIQWIHLRDASGDIVANAGPSAPPAFAADTLHTQFRNHQPVYTNSTSPAGPIVVEAFPLWLPAKSAQSIFRMAATSLGSEIPRQIGVIEVAALLNTAHGALWPVRRNLLINLSAALALLAALTWIALRFRSYIEGRQIEKQLEIARRVQMDLLPSTRPYISSGFDIAADCISANAIGGDFFDVFSTLNGASAFVLGDVSGNGIPAALLMGVIHGAVRSSSWTDSPAQHEAATARINTLLCDRSSRERYATMFWAYFDPQNQMLRYVNAGHFPPLLFKASRRQTLLRLSSGGPVLGLLPGIAYQQGVVRLEPGDVLVLYSDGIVDANGPGEEHFGEDRLREAASSAISGKAEDIRNGILAAVRAFTGQASPEDDRTLLVVRYTGSEARNGHRFIAAA